MEKKEMKEKKMKIEMKKKNFRGEKNSKNVFKYLEKHEENNFKRHGEDTEMKIERSTY